MKTMNAIRIHEQGGPEVLRLEEVPLPEPGTGEALIRIHAAGLNFLDIYQRSGQYKGELPFTPGNEGAGEVIALGANVGADVNVGDRVAFVMHLGAFAEYACVPVAKLVPVHPKLNYEQAAAVLLQGMTAQYLATSTFPVQRGQTVLVQAAAGGVGLLLTQIVKDLGARVIGTVSTPEKAALAREAGADELVVGRDVDFVAAVKAFSGGKGCDVVYDSVGKTTFLSSLDCLRSRGMMVLFGNSSGPAPGIEPAMLGAKGGLFLTRPSLANYTATREELLTRAKDVQERVATGRLRVHVGKTFALADVAKAQTELAARRTVGKVLLTAP